MKLGWGKCNIYRKNSVNGAPANGEWTKLPTPRENTTQVATAQGTDLEAKIEGGEIIDRLPGKNTYTLEWEEFVEKGQSPSFTDNDGVVSGNYALKAVPDEDEACPGIQIDNCTIKAEIVYSTNDALRVKYSATALKPASGNAVKLLNVGGAAVSTFSLKVANTEKATQASSAAVALTAGAVELTVTGTHLDRSTAAQMIVGGNIINLTKDTANSTASSAKFTGSTSAGALTAVSVDGNVILSLPAA